MKYAKVMVALLCFYLATGYSLNAYPNAATGGFLPNAGNGLTNSTPAFYLERTSAEAATLTPGEAKKKGSELYKAGVAQNKKKHYAKAIDYLAQSDRYLKNHADTFYQLGISYEGLKKYVVAARKYREAVRLNSKHKSARAALKCLDRGPRAIMISSES